jgi:hypothetical protein
MALGVSPSDVREDMRRSDLQWLKRSLLRTKRVDG